MTWRIVADTSCDLFTLEGTEGKIDFATIPFTIRIGEKEFVDDEHISIEDMLTANENHSEPGQTACPSPEDWREKFSASGPVLAFTISSALSGSYNSACTAKTMLLEEEPDQQIAVIDSRANGPEITLLIMKAKEMILAGESFERIEDALVREAEKVHTVFALSSYRNLIKAGRVGRLAGFIAGRLGFWGIGVGSDAGEIEVCGKARGNKGMIRFLVEKIRETGLAGKEIRVNHCRNREDAELLRERLEAAFPGVRVILAQTRGLDSFYAERSGLIVAF